MSNTEGSVESDNAPTPWNVAREAKDATQAKKTPLASGQVQGAFVGRRGRVFWMALRFGVYTLLTVGMYRFWMKTRLRRWYWSSVRIGGIPLEYVGDPLEKVLGFLIAVVFLAFYIGVVNLLLMFASFSLFQGEYPAYILSFAGVIPFWFYARYRARRYVLARTRWRGVRFGLAPGAWGYVGRALALWIVTILSAGMLWPLKTFWLEKYVTDRTWFGTVRMEQGGRWTMLFRPFLNVVFPGVGLAGLMIWVGYSERFKGGEMAAGAVLAVWSLIGLVHYQVQAKRLLANAKRAANMGLVAEPRTRTVFRIYVVGYGIAGIVSSVALVPIALAGLIVFEASGGSMGAVQEILAGMPVWAAPVVGGLSYFAMFLMWSALRQAFVTMPLWRLYADTLSVIGADAMGQVQQRPRDEFAEAEGFAEALDVGAAI
ncbi:DUF898 family protein [Shimia abyssi]|uniref:DUF898 family protein n=1 Tax=Shimia abyssi TaxID=1662395 RepID=UPI001FAFCC41|nr:DUF898 family protein [Shimia abyssi]